MSCLFIVLLISKGLGTSVLKLMFYDKCFPSQSLVLRLRIKALDKQMNYILQYNEKLIFKEQN